MRFSDTMLRKGGNSMSGSELFWSSGTWVFFLGQAAVVALVVYLYWYQGRQEARAQKETITGNFSVDN